MSGMELVFNTKDVIYIVGLIIGGMGAWFKLKMDKQKMENEILILEKEMLKADEQYKESTLNAKNGRRAIEKNLMEQIEKREQVTHQRIDRVRDDNIKSYEKLENKIEGLETKYDSTTKEILTAIQNSK